LQLFCCYYSWCLYFCFSDISTMNSNNKIEHSIIIIIIIIIIIWMSLVTGPFFPVLHMFQVLPSFVVNLSNVFPVQLPNFSLSFSLLFEWLVQPYISGSTFAVSLYINSCILTSFPLPFAQHYYYYYHHHHHHHFLYAGYLYFYS